MPRQSLKRHVSTCRANAWIAAFKAGLFVCLELDGTQNRDRVILTQIPSLPLKLYRERSISKFNSACGQLTYRLQARGLEEGQVPHTGIEEMAAYHIDALQSVQAKGPYRLGRWTASGVVAFEMVQQLHARGHKVSLLALLDARIPSSGEDFADEDFEATLLADFIRYFGLSMNSRESLARLPKDELLTRVLEQAKLSEVGASRCSSFSSPTLLSSSARLTFAPPKTTFLSVIRAESRFQG
jgi:thioesterase domain-containing protein